MSESIDTTHLIGRVPRVRSAWMYIELAKPRLATLLLAVTLLTFFIASRTVNLAAVGVTPSAFRTPTGNSILFFVLAAGVTLYAAGMFALNQYLERDVDRLMPRTATRPLPSGRMEPRSALVFGVVTVFLGTMVLTVGVNVWCGLLAAANLVIYIGIYTPLKKITPVHTFIGAFAGAMPPLVGWAAATGHLGIEAWALAAIVFAWQFPHFYAVELKNIRDYRRAGIRVLPVTDEKGGRVRLEIVVYTALTLVASLVPPVIGLVRWWYVVPAVALWIPFGYRAWETCRHYDSPHARKLLKTSVMYLPLVFAAIGVSLV